MVEPSTATYYLNLNLAEAPSFAGAVQGSNLPLARRVGNVFGGPERERLDRHRRLAATARHETTAITYEKVRHVVRAVEPIDNGALGIIPHATGTQKMY
jgi:hypothetical protein